MAFSKDRERPHFRLDQYRRQRVIRLVDILRYRVQRGRTEPGGRAGICRDGSADSAVALLFGRGAIVQCVGQIGFRASPRTGVRSGFCDATDRSVLGHRRWRSHTSCRFLASGGDGLRSFVDLVHIAQWTSNHETLDVDRATPVPCPLKASGEQATSEANLKIVAFGLQ